MASAQDLETLHLAGIDDVDALVQAAAAFVRAHARTPSAVTSPLSSGEKDLLRGSGALGLEDDDDAPALQAGPASIVGQYAQLVAGALTTDAVARWLGVVPSRVRQRVTARSLYAIDAPRGRVFPAFQFDASGSVLPGLARVLAVIDSSVHPVTVERFFLAPAPDLESDIAQDTLSPRDWLLAGLPVDEVVILARDL